MTSSALMTIAVGSGEGMAVGVAGISVGCAAQACRSNIAPATRLQSALLRTSLMSNFWDDFLLIISLLLRVLTPVLEYYRCYSIFKEAGAARALETNSECVRGGGGGGGDRRRQFWLLAPDP